MVVFVHEEEKGSREKGTGRREIGLEG